MMRPLVCFSTFTAATAAKVKYDATSHVPHASSGCGGSSPYSSGKTTAATATYGGIKYTYRVYVPKSYDSNNPMPLITQHPGWGMSAKSEQSGSGVCDNADSMGYICVVPQGDGDNSNRGGPWYSWNAAGTVFSPGAEGPTCTSAGSNPSYCYNSCSCPSLQCWWTTCHNEVSATGTGYSGINGYIPALYDTLESQLCVDTTREYVAGESNGGIMTYQLATAMSSRFAAAVPQFGSFHKGYLQNLQTGVPLLSFHGTKDTTVPANVSLSGDGYYYTPTETIFSTFATANGCSGASSQYKTPYDGQSSLYCWTPEGSCSGGDLVRCSWDGGHNWFGNSAKTNGGLVTWFAFQWTETEHLGFGGKTAPHLLEDIEIIDADEEQPGAFDDLDVTLTALEHGHYNDPANGCLDDEHVVNFGTGHSCAPKIGTNSSDGEPFCKLGSVLPDFENGCPTDAPVPAASKAFPVCLGKGVTEDPYGNGEFHCALACPCESVVDDSCGPQAHAHCPTGSVCERGELRNMGQGVCTYSKDYSTAV